MKVVSLHCLKIRQFVLLSFLVFIPSGCITRDVTHDAKFQTDFVQSGIYFWKINLFMTNNGGTEGGASFQVVPPNYPGQIEEYESSSSLMKTVKILPRGTRFQFERLIFSTTPEGKYLSAIGKLLDGKFAGTLVILPELPHANRLLIDPKLTAPVEN